MSLAEPSPRLESAAAVSAHLEALVALDPRLASVREIAGTVEPRITQPGFPGIAKVICGQQLSVVSAAAIWKRFEALPGALDPQTYLLLTEEQVRATGFSSGKFRTVRVIAQAIVAGELDFTHLETLPAPEAVSYLVAHKGIGPWTAEVYLMFCAGHPDVFPAGDLALLKAVQHGLGLDARPTIKDMIGIAEAWSPHRSAAALMFWRYFAVLRDREGILL
ncbi:DNA-3-methyladenine glycosylase family protein [Devosia submarina]|uniref:DNA-3-methyladenine glycosylase family protein n=1 Tax=Devosia submarina TaxID=1173082 RepID=UPI000D362FF6|nr:DNA-3-methyladenine glycosylase [Devosia submarina]